MEYLDAIGSRVFVMLYTEKENQVRADLINVLKNKYTLMIYSSNIQYLQAFALLQRIDSIKNNVLDVDDNISTDHNLEINSESALPLNY